MSSNKKSRIEAETDSFVALRRHLKSDFLSGKVTRNEFILLFWLFMTSNIYGIATANLDSLRADMFPGVKPDYVGKILRELLRKKYIYYPPHQGQQGSFEVHLDNWLIENRQWRRITHMFETGVKQQETPTESKGQEEVSPKSDDVKRKYFVEKAQLASGFNTARKMPKVRSGYKDNEKEKNKDTIDSKNNFAYKATVPVEGFNPTNSDEARCLEVARALGESHMDYVLSVFKKHGLGLVERAYGLYKEQAAISPIQNPPAYFNKIVQQLIAEQSVNLPVPNDSAPI
jgi:hypothetical protein